MDTNIPPRRPASKEYAGSPRKSAPRITAVRRDQMPGDVSTAFLPQDIILFCQPSQTQTQARPKSLPTTCCRWCMADGPCAGLLETLIILVCFARASIQDKGTLAYHVLGYTLDALEAISILLTLVLTFVHRGSNGYDSVKLRYPQGVTLHCVHSLAHRMLSPSSLFLLQQPMLNFRSFFRFYQFFNNGQPGGPSIQDVDSCIRHHAAEAMLSGVGLLENGSCALLGLAPCQNRLTDFGLSKLQGLYQSFQDWRRWRLAALVCRQLQARDCAPLQQGDLNDNNDVNPLESLGGGDGCKWFLVDPQIFSSQNSLRLRRCV